MGCKVCYLGNDASRDDLYNLKCDVLFVSNKNDLNQFIDNIYEHNLYETENIDYIIVEDQELLKLIVDNYEIIQDTKIEESWDGNNNKSLYRFFRINNIKLHTVVKNFRNFYYIEDANGEYVAIDNKEVSKCFDYFKDGVNHYEKDINLMLRYSLEKIKNKKYRFGKHFRIINFDIETLASVDAVNTPEPIICIASHDNFTGEVKYFEMRELKEEKKMLEDFFKYASQFDIITGFNITKFDIPYLINRARKVGVNLSLLTGISTAIPSCKYREDDRINSWFNIIPGLSIVDLIGLAEKSIGYLDVKLPDKKLDTLGKYILGEQKVEVDTPAILFNNKEFEKLKEYTIQDVNISVKLDDKLGLIELLIATIELVPGLNIDAAVWNSKIIDFYLLSKFPDIVMPSVNRDRVRDIKGAIVFDTLAGIHDEVGIFDCSGMYPSLIRTFNISPDTKDINGDIRLGNVRFDSSRKGILVKLVDDFTEMRKYYKQKKQEHEKDKDYKLWQLKEFTVKKVLASTYGVFGFVGFRFFDNDIANSITFAGRELLTHMRDFSIKNGYKVIMGDTDGIAVSRDNPPADYEKLESYMNDSLKQFIQKYTNNDNIINNHKINIEYETIFSRVIFTTAKKKYMGLVTMSKGKKLDTPQFYGKGNELIRKDTPRGMKEELRKIVMEVLNNEDKAKNIEIIKIKLREIKLSLPTWTKDDLIIYKEINRNFEDYKVKPIHVRGALNSNKYLGTNFSRQDYKGGYIFVKCKVNPAADVLFMNENTKLNSMFTIDYDKYYEKFVLDKIKLIFGDKIYNEVTNKNKNLNEWLER